ncbi:MAG: tRNA (guanosine(37)-N1)-methyltransferase TrmD [Moraxellaceae bacterium]|nr:tRNA (guanosine(37)-N1)-methyltransferase TrmD [Moraxellaceae bacterium]MDP1775725.1 tRNA (guanosine(37)-N1)-methyltransferase TrmD [Moraxellaceae bacterium]MDZ4297546.1 tRNA (guanosine(37)-N1)-methyltransferase TrmD [Moraxellaceae bacterium]MDZ4387861.1 tRNA (guanosine(37)-N1)-methyltransferase TrmD [Moraxellaceae bacterium]
MWVGLITLFPEMLRAISESGVTARAVATGKLTLASWNPRDFTEDNYRRVDDRPYGGGPGMLMQIEPLRRALNAAREAAKAQGLTPTVIYLSPQGQVLTQAAVKTIATEQQALILLCGRYEGVDERLIASEVDAEWSIGDYVLSGGELPAMVLIDAVARLLPGVLNSAASAEEDSFVDGLLDCPHYTRPEVYDGMAVPEVLLSGDHAAIRRWRLQQSLWRTQTRRPDLLAKRSLSAEEHALLAAMAELPKP